SKQVFARFASVLERTSAVGRFQHFATVKHVQHVWQIAIAHIGHLSQGELPVGFAGAAAYENKFAVVRSIGIEFEKVLDLRWLAIFVHAKKADIEIVPWILKVVGVT